MAAAAGDSEGCACPRPTTRFESPPGAGAAAAAVAAAAATPDAPARLIATTALPPGDPDADGPSRDTMRTDPPDGTLPPAAADVVTETDAVPLDFRESPPELRREEAVSSLLGRLPAARLSTRNWTSFDRGAGVTAATAAAVAVAAPAAGFVPSMAAGCGSSVEDFTRFPVTASAACASNAARKVLYVASVLMVPSRGSRRAAVSGLGSRWYGAKLANMG